MKRNIFIFLFLLASINVYSQNTLDKILSECIKEKGEYSIYKYAMEFNRPYNLNDMSYFKYETRDYTSPANHYFYYCISDKQIVFFNGDGEGCYNTYDILSKFKRGKYDVMNIYANFFRESYIAINKGTSLDFYHENSKSHDPVTIFTGTTFIKKYIKK